MKKIITDYFDMKYNVSYNGIITDIPYKGCIRGKLGEEDFDIIEFLYKADNDTLTDSFLITFCNMRCLIDIVNACNLSNWTYHTYQIWDKSPTRNWISWTMPLRTTEYIVYLKKGKYKYCFKDGTEKPAYKRKSFGGKLKSTTKNTNKKSYGMYSEIVTFKNPRKKIHPTEKPKEFSTMFKQIVGNVLVLDPFCGTGNLICEFDNSLGVDVVNY